MPNEKERLLFVWLNDKMKKEYTLGSVDLSNGSAKYIFCVSNFDTQNALAGGKGNEDEKANCS